MRRVDGGDLEAGAGQPERQRQLARQVEGLGRGDRLVERLQLLVGLVGSPRRLLGPVLDVVAQDHLRPQQRREGRQVLRHLRPNAVGDRARELPEHQQRLRAVASVHMERLRFLPVGTGPTATAGPELAQISHRSGACQRGGAAKARKNRRFLASPLVGLCRSGK